MIANNFLLPQIDDFIGGDNREFIFTIIGESGRPLDVSLMDMKFSLIESNNKFGTQIVLEKNATPTLNYEHNLVCDFKIKLVSTETIGMCGKYIYQLSIVDQKKNVRIEQGILIAGKNINEKGTLSQISSMK